MGETLSPREALQETCPACAGQELPPFIHPCSRCGGTGVVVRTTHEPASGIGYEVPEGYVTIFANNETLSKHVEEINEALMEVDPTLAGFNRAEAIRRLGAGRAKAMEALRVYRAWADAMIDFDFSSESQRRMENARLAAFDFRKKERES